MTKMPDANPVLQGATTDLLFGEGKFDSDELLKKLRGSLYGTGDREGGTGFLRGRLHTARSVFWQLGDIGVWF